MCADQGYSGRSWESSRSPWRGGSDSGGDGDDDPRARSVLKFQWSLPPPPSHGACWSTTHLSQPGFGVVLAARALGDDKKRFADSHARKNYSGQSPITRASGKKTVVLARYATNRRLGDALHLQASSALVASPGAGAYYDALRARKIGHHAARVVREASRASSHAG